MKLHLMCKAYDPMTGDELDALVNDIAREGQREPIITYEGEILDGQNRYTACIMAGVTPKYRAFKGTPTEARNFVASVNGNRRHSTPASRAMSIAKLDEALGVTLAKSGGQRAESATLPTRSITDQARDAEVSERTMQDARTVLSDATVTAQVDAKEITVHAAAKKIREQRKPPAAPVAESKPRATKEETLQKKIDALLIELTEKDGEIATLRETLATALEETAAAVEEAQNLRAIANGDEADRLRILTATLRAVTAERDTANRTSEVKTDEIKRLNQIVAKLEGKKK